MKREEVLAWVAGYVAAAGSYVCQVQEGPSKKYLGFELAMPTNDEQQIERLSVVTNNGSVDEFGYWRIGGYAAARGFLAEVWKYLTPSARAQANEAIKHYKAHRNGPF